MIGILSHGINRYIIHTKHIYNTYKTAHASDTLNLTKAKNLCGVGG